MINLGAVFTIALLLVFIPQITTYLWHILLSLWSSRRERSIIDYKCLDYKDYIVSFILPVRKEPLDYIENTLRYIHSTFISNYEVIIVSDDPPDDKEKLLNTVKELREQG
ncbi:MAG: hypothetical protein QXE81_03350, partial [Desulfurococcaceae archaeon]